MYTRPQATAKLYDVSYWFLSTTRICVWKETTISIVPTNIFWVFFTLLFNPNHPNLDPQYSHPISSAKTSAKCQAMTKTFWINWRKQVLFDIHSPPHNWATWSFSGVVLAKHSSLNTYSFLLEPIKHQRPQIPTYLPSCVMCWLVICTPSRRHHYILPITTFRQLCWILLIWSVHWNILFDKMQPEVQTKRKIKLFQCMAWQYMQYMQYLYP